MFWATSETSSRFLYTFSSYVAVKGISPIDHTSAMRRLGRLTGSRWNVIQDAPASTHTDAWDTPVIIDELINIPSSWASVRVALIPTSVAGIVTTSLSFVMLTSWNRCTSSRALRMIMSEVTLFFRFTLMKVKCCPEFCSISAAPY